MGEKRCKAASFGIPVTPLLPLLFVSLEDMDDDSNNKKLRCPSFVVQEVPLFDRPFVRFRASTDRTMEVDVVVPIDGLQTSFCCRA